MRPTTAGLTLRNATFSDGPFLLALRNSADVRSQSKNSDIISEDTHQKWLEKQLGNPNTAIWIIERSGEKQGYIRTQRLEEGIGNSWLLSIALQPSARKQRSASWALKEACRLMREDVGAQMLVAEVLVANEAGHRLFMSAGFVGKLANTENASGVVRFEFPLMSGEDDVNR